MRSVPRFKRMPVDGKQDRREAATDKRGQPSGRVIWWVVSAALVAAGIAAGDLQALHLPDLTPAWDVSRTGLLVVGIPLAVLSVSMVTAAVLRGRRAFRRISRNPLPGDRFRQAREKRGIGLRSVWMVCVGAMIGGLSAYLIMLALSEH